MRTVESGLSPAQQPAEASLAPGAVIADRYEIRAVAAGASGGLGAFLAHDRVTGADVVLKTAPGAMAGAYGGAPAVMRAALAARNIRHPAVAAIYDAGETNGLVYFVTELVEGLSLRDWNRRLLGSGGQLGISPIYTLVMMLIEILIALNAQNAVSVDLKPANIMLLSDPAEPDVRIKLTGVGLPAAEEVTGGTGTGFGGDPYRAPEALTAGSAAPLQSASVYSLAMILYELLAGVPLSGHWRAPSEGRTDVSPALDQLIQTALSNNPRLRPQSLEAFRDALIKAAQTNPAPQPGGDPKPAPRNDPKPEPKPKPVKTWAVPDFLVPVLKAINMPLSGIIMLLQVIGGFIPMMSYGGRVGAGPPRRGAAQAFAGLAVIAVVALAGWAAWTWMKDGGFSLIAQDETLDGEPQDDGADRMPNLEPDDLKTPEPEPVTPRSRFASFNGYWTDDFGGTWNVAADNSGAVQAVSVAGMLAGSQMAGAFSGQRFEFFVGNAYGSASAAGSFDGQCHINYQTLDPYGSGRMVNAVFHINHQPGAPCP